MKKKHLIWAAAPWIACHAQAQSSVTLYGLIDVGVLTKDTHRNTIRFAPPLIISESEIDWAIDRLAEVFDVMMSAAPEPIAEASS